MSGLWTWDPESDAVTWSASVPELYGVPAAATTYDEQDLGNLDVVSVRRQTGVVLQGGSLFQGDILRNIVGSGLYTLYREHRLGRDKPRETAPL